MPNYSGIWTSRQQLQAIGNNTWTGLPLFTFTTFTFTNAAATGQNGPTLGQCQTAYAGQTWLAEYFTVSPQGFQQWTVPVTGNYAIEVAGAPGGGSTSGQAPVRVTAGSGRHISQTIALTQGDVLVMVIGQTGVRGTYAGGGGGGTFVIRSGSVLISAGGGGGDGYYVATQRGQDSQDVLVGNPSTGGTGGTGQGGGGGGGFGGDGGDGQTGGVSGFGGKGYSNSFVGGAGYPTDGNGGFGGGGGAGGGTGANSGGGGGGYAGGNGCNGGSPFTASAQGGSCYVATGSPTYLGYNTGQGFITITKV